jgi:DNA-binding Lrp family transcriptional regulator
VTRGNLKPQRPDHGWYIGIPTSFSDARQNPMSVRKRVMLMLLDGFCRDRPYCLASNSELAAAYGCGKSALGDLLKELEADGWIHRVAKLSGFPGRVGIILLKRVDPEQPTAEASDVPRLAATMREVPASDREIVAAGEEGGPH